MKLKSTDYAALIRMIAKGAYNITLGKTQVLKLLYILYGMYYANTNKALFDDDKIQAWPYGPVVPSVYFSFKEGTIENVSEEVLDSLFKDNIATNLLVDVVRERASWSAIQLTRWSHEYMSPWYKAVYGEDGKKESSFGNVIDDGLIKNYFENYILG
ncbi:MAG: DUF4065 domain-containing protein [Prevotellaceae bacterium]|nr:DUF4065 domain-containing protein [Candidatus Faecinaster equi]